MATMPGYLPPTGVSLDQTATPGSTGQLPAYQPIAPSSSYTALANALQGQQSLSGFLPGVGAGAANQAVASPGGGASGAPALPSTVPGAVGGGNHGLGYVPAASTAITPPSLHNYVTGATPGFNSMFLQSPRFAHAGAQLPQGMPALPQGGLAALFAQLFGGQGAPQGQNPNPQTPAVPAQPASGASPWASLAQWLQGTPYQPVNPTGTPVGQQ